MADDRETASRHTVMKVSVVFHPEKLTQRLSERRMRCICRTRLEPCVVELSQSLAMRRPDSVAVVHEIGGSMGMKSTRAHGILRMTFSSRRG